MKVLFVDDSRGYLNILSKLLQAFPEIKPSFAISSETAIDLIDDVDAVVTDYSLVGETGEDVAKLCKGKPVFCLTGHKPSVDIPSRFRKVFEKPSDLDQWDLVISALISLQN